MSQYLYGASVQGIQQFIFSTNKLREISGASEIVEYICTDFLQERLNELGGYEEDKLLMGAAGNIKYLFDSEDTCERFVYDFPRLVMEMAPGITISQAVVKFDGDLTQDHIQQLEIRLKTQRNRTVVHHGLGLMVSERSRRTGQPGVDWTKEGVIDTAQAAKREFAQDSKASLLKKLLPDTKGRGYHKLFPVEMEDIAGRKDKKNWIAIIHADGNDLGKKIMAQGILKEASLRELSIRLERATEQAARKAFKAVVEGRIEKDALFPFRPIVLGGDDLTVIIRGDLAIDFTHFFLNVFEEETREEFKNFGSDSFQGGLTACAGIAFIKSNYPFHYGVHLAEELCKRAKKVAKGMRQKNTPSCLLFHKVHSSFTEEYETIISQELSIEAKTSKLRLDFGPYFLTPQKEYATIEQLTNWVTVLNQRDSPKSRLRNWLSEIQANTESAEQALLRIKEISAPRYIKKLNLDEVFVQREKAKHTHLFDIISLSSIENNRK